MKIKKIFLFSALLCLMAYPQDSYPAEYTDSFKGSKISFSMETKGFTMPEATENMILKGIVKLHRIYVDEFGTKYKQKKKGMFQDKAGSSFRIKLFEDQKSFLDYAKEIKIGVKYAAEGRAFYNLKHKLLVIHLEGDTAPTIFHEVSHFFFNTQFVGVNRLWLNEGLAVYFSNLDMFQEETTIKPYQSAYYMLKDYVTKNPEAVKLKDYFSLSSKEWRTENEQMNYVMGWSLVHFMMSSEEGKKTLKKILDYAKIGGSIKSIKKNLEVSIVSLINRSYKGGTRKRGGLEKFEEDWLNFVNSDTPLTSHKI